VVVAVAVNSSETIKKNNVSGLVFISSQHQGIYRMTKFVSESCGPFLSIANEYLGGFAFRHYRDLKTPRAALCTFFRFLRINGTRSIARVTPKTITRFLTWAEQEGQHRSAVYGISAISTFFSWMIAEGRYTSGNPVVGLIHNRIQRRSKPRPFEKEELELAWQLLQARGDVRLCFAAAVGLEAGLRISEICRLRLQDVDLKRKTLFRDCLVAIGSFPWYQKP
jgi:integrase